MQFFYNSNLFGSCIIHILYTGCAKNLKKNSGAKRLKCKLDVNYSITFVVGNLITISRTENGSTTKKHSSMQLSVGRGLGS